MNVKPKTKTRLFVIAGIVVAIPVVAIFGLCLFVGLGMTSGHFADTKVLPGDKLPKLVSKTVTESAGLAPGERIVYFYSSAFTPKGDGNLLTNKRVISYVDDGIDQWCESIAIEDIASVHFEQSDNWIDDSTITVVSADGTELTLFASNEADGDAKFAKAIRAAAKLDGR